MAPTTSRRYEPALLLVAGLAYIGIVAGAASRFTFWIPEDWLLFSQRADPSTYALFAPINGHWSTVTVVVTEVMLRLVGLSFPAYLAVVTAIHFVVVALVYALLVDVLPRWLALLGAGLVLFLSSASEILFEFVSVGFLMSMVFGLAALLVGRAPEWGTRRSAGIFALLVGALMSSGAGVVMVVANVAAQIPTRRALVPAATLLVYAAWALAWPSGYGYPARASVLDYAGHAAYRLGSSLVGSGPQAVLVVAVGMIVVAIATVRGWRPSRISVAGAVGLGVLYAAVGYRGGWDPSYVDPSRYAYPAVILALLAVLPALAELPFVAAVIVVAAIASNVAGFPHAIDNWEAQSRVFDRQGEAAIAGQLRAGGILKPLGPSVGAYLRTVERWGRPARVR